MKMVMTNANFLYDVEFGSNSIFDQMSYLWSTIHMMFVQWGVLCIVLPIVLYVASDSHEDNERSHKSPTEK